MQPKGFESHFDAEMQSHIDRFVSTQDFQVIATPLKTSEQYKAELKDRMTRDYSYQNIMPSLSSSAQLINQHLIFHVDKAQSEKIKCELSNAFDHFNEIRNPSSVSAEDFWKEHIKCNTKPWTLLGISKETLLTIYEIALVCFDRNEMTQAKSLLKLLLVFAPTIPSYWNALGFFYQKEKDLEAALQHYLFSEQVDPDHLETYFYISRCYLAMNQYLLAYEQVDKLIKLMNLSPELKKHWQSDVEKLARDIRPLAR